MHDTKIDRVWVNLTLNRDLSFENNDKEINVIFKKYYYKHNLKVCTFYYSNTIQKKKESI